MTARSSSVGGTAAMGTSVRLSARRVGGCRSIKASIGACAANERRQLNAACVIRSPTIRNPANRTAELLGRLESQVLRYFRGARSKKHTTAGIR